VPSFSSYAAVPVPMHHTVGESRARGLPAPAGYVAIEVVAGRLGERDGGFAPQQFGTVLAGAQVLHYEVVPGSGHGELTGISGAVQLNVDSDGTHHYVLDPGGRGGARFS